ncbi:hypothetical protein SAMN05428996_1600 [Quadrisphaera sp. DSM 44207]|nr:hypothetical protein SAMN05428996_1600 [Quadrisphaera sp. DSM 44207]
MLPRRSEPTPERASTPPTRTGENTARGLREVADGLTRSGQLPAPTGGPGGWLLDRPDLATWASQRGDRAHVRGQPLRPRPPGRRLRAAPGQRQRRGADQRPAALRRAGTSAHRASGHLHHRPRAERLGVLRPPRQRPPFLTAGGLWRYDTEEDLHATFDPDSTFGSLALPSSAIAEAASTHDLAQAGGARATAVRFWDDVAVDEGAERYRAGLMRLVHDQATAPRSPLASPLVRAHLTRTPAAAALVCLPNTTMSTDCAPGAGNVGPPPCAAPSHTCTPTPRNPSPSPTSAPPTAPGTASCLATPCTPEATRRRTRPLQHPDLRAPGHRACRGARTPPRAAPAPAPVGTSRPGTDSVVPREHQGGRAVGRLPEPGRDHRPAASRLGCVSRGVGVPSYRARAKSAGRKRPCASCPSICSRLRPVSSGIRRYRKTNPAMLNSAYSQKV